MEMKQPNPESLQKSGSDNFKDGFTETPFIQNKGNDHHCQKIKIPVLSDSEECMDEPGNNNVVPDSSDDTYNFKRFLGLLLTILSSMMFSINALIFKILKSYHPSSNATYMFLFTGLLAIPFYIYETFTLKRKSDTNLEKDVTSRNASLKISSLKDIPARKFLILLARSFTGCSGMLFFFYSLQYLTIGDALVIACSSTVFVFLFAFLFLKESCGIIPILTIILALIGVGIISRPPLLTGRESFEPEDLIGAALASASMLCIASTLILMRYLQDVHHSLINLIYGTWGFIQTLLLTLALNELKFPETILDGTLMTTTGLLFFVGQTMLALALQLEEAGPVSLLRTSEVVFAFVWQFVFLNVAPDQFRADKSREKMVRIFQIYVTLMIVVNLTLLLLFHTRSVAGAVLIMIGILTTILRKWVGSLPQSNETRERFSFILR